MKGFTRAITGNEFINGDGFFVSFAGTQSILAGTCFGPDNGGDETALVKGHEFRILNGDWRKEYALLVPQGWDACLAFFEEKIASHESSWSSACAKAAHRARRRMTNRTMTFSAKQIADWRRYERVRLSARYNMYDPRARRATKLSNESYSYVMRNFSSLRDAALAQGGGE